VYVTHDQEEAMALGDQVVVMDNGKIMQTGTPYEIYASPKNDFVAKFIGTANIYDADVHPGAGGRLDVRLGFGTLSVDESLARTRWPGLLPGRARLLCRPQHVSIAEPGHAHATIKITECLFLGDRIRVTGETDNRKVMRFEAHNSSPVKPGDSVPIRLDVDSIHFIDPAA
jgi:putative spermidine/putrescine transport system ATP-binding protein